MVTWTPIRCHLHDTSLGLPSGRPLPTSRNTTPYLGITGGFSDTHVGSLGRVRWGPCHVVSIHCGRETLLRYHAGHTRATPAACNRGPFSYVTACQPLRRLARPGPSLSGSDRGSRSWKWAASIPLIPSSQMRNSWGTTFLSEPDVDTLHNRMWDHCSPTAVTENATSVVATAAGPGSVRVLSTESDGPPPPAGSSPEEHLHPGPHSTVMPV